MNRLWSPWRSKYVTAQAPPNPGCIFCRFPEESGDVENLLVHRGQLAYVILNRYPYNSGHSMIVPYQHASGLDDLSRETLTELMSLLQLSLRALQTAFMPDGFNTGMNLGAAAGAGIADHIHMHAVPRWTGDTNFMATVGDIKVMSERLEDSYTKFRTALQKELEGGPDFHT